MTNLGLQGIAIARRNFTLSYDTNIPRQVGLAGSSAIVTATFRCLMKFFKLTDNDIPKEMQPNFILQVRQLRHHFGPFSERFSASPRPTFFSRFSASRHPARAVCYALLSTHAGCVLIGARDPMLCPNWGFRRHRHRDQAPAGRPGSAAAATRHAAGWRQPDWR